MVTFGTLWLDSQPGELHHTRQSRAGGEAGALYRVNQPLALRADGGAGPVKERRTDHEGPFVDTATTE